jgi:transposase
MTLTRVDQPTDLDNVVTSFEGEIRDFVRRDFSPLRRSLSEAGGEFAVSNINSLVQRVAGASIAEIDRLTAELQNLRSLLESEGARVQRELAGYAQLNEAALKSTQAIAEGMAQWKTSLAPSD